MRTASEPLFLAKQFIFPEYLAPRFGRDLFIFEVLAMVHFCHMTLGKSFDPILSFFICKATTTISKIILPCLFYGQTVGILVMLMELLRNILLFLTRSHTAEQRTPGANRLNEFCWRCHFFLSLANFLKDMLNFLTFIYKILYISIIESLDNVVQL